jgi:HD-GYP domain-containing protein (c-di-GMP phosphodiesterase class II)
MSEQGAPDAIELTRGLMSALALRDLETAAHARRVARWTTLAASALGLSAAEAFWIELGALLHDVGKIGLPDAILRKPAALDADEWRVVRRHPEMGASLVGAFPQLAPARDIVLHHHEAWNGAGYPARLAGDAIPVAARIFAPLDAYDAMTSARPYRDGMPHDLALRRIADERGRQFDPTVVDALLSIDRPRWLTPPDSALTRESSQNRPPLARQVESLF